MFSNVRTSTFKRVEENRKYFLVVIVSVRPFFKKICTSKKCNWYMKLNVYLFFSNDKVNIKKESEAHFIFAITVFECYRWWDWIALLMCLANLSWNERRIFSLKQNKKIEIFVWEGLKAALLLHYGIRWCRKYLFVQPFPRPGYKRIMAAWLRYCIKLVYISKELFHLATNFIREICP